MNYVYLLVIRNLLKLGLGSKNEKKKRSRISIFAVACVINELAWFCSRKARYLLLFLFPKLEEIKKN